MADHHKKRRSRRDRGVARAVVTPVKSITRAVLAGGRAELAGALALHDLTERPITREDCRFDERPCPWVGCKHHLYLDVNPETGSIKVNFPSLEPWELKHTCTLDVAAFGGITLEQVGEVMNLTRERIRQVEVRGLLNLKGALAELATKHDEEPHA